MALTSGTSIEAFDTQTQLTVATPGTVADGAFSVTGDVDDWTNTNDASFASFVLAAAMPTAQPTAEKSTINLYARPMAVQSTNNTEAPDGTNLDGIYLGTFIYDNSVAVDTLQYMTIADAPLPNINSQQVIEFYINNETGGANAISNTWDLWITPKGFKVVA
jgi:hypothetical protein